MDAETLSRVLERAGAGLRVVGHRADLRLRHARLTEEQLEILLGERAVRFGPVASFEPGEELSVDALVGDEGVLLHVRTAPHRHDWQVGAVARSPTYPLVPVIPGRLPAAGGGPMLVTAEVGEETLAAVLLRLDLPGPDGRAVAPLRGHRFTAEGWALGNPDLRALRKSLGISGADGTLTARAVSTERLPDVRDLLEENGRRLTGADGPLEPDVPTEALFGEAVAGSRGDVRLRFRSGFRLRDYTYRTQVVAVNRRDLAPATGEHGEDEVLLILAIEALSPVTGLAVIFRARPVR
jgi:hypothetical protein